MTVALTYATLLLSCLDEALDAAATPSAPAPRFVMLRGGEAVRPTLSTTDDECCGGLAWVRIATTQPSAAYDQLPSGCVNHLRRTTLELGVARCFPTPDPSAMVTAEEWTAVVTQMESDHGAMEAALCCFQGLGSEITGSPDVYPGVYTPAGPEGRCIVGTLLVDIEHACACGTRG